MRPPENISDAERVEKAVRKGRIMLGPVEVGRCPHGRLFSFRWYWGADDGSTPEDGDGEILSYGCRKCSGEESDS